MKKFTFSLFLLALGYSGMAQTPPAWVQFAAPSDFQNYDVEEVSTGVDTLGNVYTAASISDTVANKDRAVIVKYNSAGVQQWKNIFNPSSTPNEAYVVSLLVDKAGNSYMCGYAFHDNTNEEDFMVIKYDKDGNKQWEQYVDGGQSQFDELTCATFDNFGNIIIAGRANALNESTGDDIAVAKISPAGSVLWSYVYNNTTNNGEDRPISVACDLNNNVFVAGSSYVTNARCIITIKLSSTGANQWTKIKTNTSNDDERAFSVVADVAGNSYITTASSEWETIKYDPNGNVLWSSMFSPGNGSLNRFNDKKVLLDKFGDVIVCGDAFFGGGSGGTNMTVQKLNGGSGASVWSVNQNIQGIDHFTDATLDTSANIYVGGYFEGPQGADMFTSIVHKSGAILWTNKFSNSSKATGTDRPYQIVVDKNRNVIMAGVSETRGNGSDDAVDVVTLKYSTLITGIQELAKENSFNMSVYPNPAHESITLHLTDPALLGATISIVNVTGSLVYEERLTALDQQLALTALAKGVYFLKLTNNNATAVKKLVVE